MNNIEELKPCPFCGGKAHLLTSNGSFLVECSACLTDFLNGPVGIGWYHSEKDAAAGWNDRPSERALIAQLEAAQKSNAFLKEQMAQLANFNPDWDKLEASQDSWRELSALQKETLHRAELAEAALSAVQLDATRWRALLSSPAIRILGHAGLQDDKPIDGHYCHFGMEIWSHHEPYYDNKKAGELITRYADNMIAASLVEGNADAE
ncbi:Lar family restriction alleviation protein [Yersinia enterocolitica]|uniref:Lar family restriction alleviation protein n=1 Tax=Yersinia enterocolitica TaxID=630 RepID=UPI003CFFC427|nr:hypothetical protein [Yersinia enterocolitica]